MSDNSKLLRKRFNKGFTLIELLVVIAIISILSTIVLASLNSAREKAKIALIKSTLRQMYTQAGLNYAQNGSFIGSNTSYTDLTCSGNLLKIAQPLIDQGIIIQCFSFGGALIYPPYTVDNYQRFGATALMYDAGELKAWSVDETGVVKWDLKGVTSTGAEASSGDISMNWATANAACSTFGARLPSIEQLRTLSFAWALVDASYTPDPTLGSFLPGNYWSSTPAPWSPSLNSYDQLMYSPGNLAFKAQANFDKYVRCVR